MAERFPTLAYLTGEYPRGTDTFIQREVRAVRNAGATVHTFSVRPADSANLDQAQRAELASTRHLLPASANAVASAHARLAVSSPRRYLGALATARRLAPPGARGSAKQFAYFAEAGLLARELQRRGVDHLHNHFADSSCTVAMLASQLSGVPFSFTLHGPRIFFAADTWHVGDKVRAAAFCSCISWFARSQAAVLAPDAIDSCHVIHCGVETSFAGDRSGAGATESVDSKDRLVFVGRLAEEKGLLVLLDAVTRLSASRPGLLLALVGDGPERARIEAEVASRGLDGVVELLGHRPPSEVARLVAGATVFVLPSFAEGVPVSLMEAMASGVPVVATAVGGVGELVEDGVSGEVVRPGDVDALVDALAKLLDEPERRARYGTAGRAKVSNEFDSDVEGRRLLRLVVDSLDGRTSPTRPDPV